MKKGYNLQALFPGCQRSNGLTDYIQYILRTNTGKQRKTPSFRLFLKFIYTLPKKSLLILLIPGLAGLVQGQDNIPVIPPSPNAASLGVYGEIPVGHTTGTPRVNIPLCALQGQQLQVPISLSYHSTGVKVNDIASWVGLGYSLQAGGVITRVVRGHPDEGINGYRKSLPLRSSYDYGCTQDFTYLRSLADGSIPVDAQPDMYYFNVLGYSGKFVMDYDGTVQLLPYQDIRIVEKALHWEITTPDGTRYIFGKEARFTEQTDVETPDNQYNQGMSYISSWYLKEIISPDGVDKISFTYVEENPQAQAVIETESNSYKIAQNLQGNGPGAQNCEDSFAKLITSTTIQTKLLQKITSVHGSIEFEANTLREDIPQAKRLDAIAVKDATGKVWKRFTLGYHYLNAGAGNPLEKRLVLDRVQEEAIDSDTGVRTTKPPHTFEYNEAISLPSRKSYAQDHWGYYNGKNSNKELIPSMLKRVFADRSMNSGLLTAGMLTGVGYPTGGSTTIEYEPHEYAITSQNQLQLNCDERSFDVANASTSCVGACESSEVTFFTVEKEREMSVRFFLDYNISDAFSEEGPLVAIYKLGADSDPASIETKITEYREATGSSTIDKKIYLRKGHYMLKASIEIGLALDKSRQNTVYGRVFYRDLACTPEQLINGKGGGIRVKRTITRDGISEENTLVQNYSYRWSHQPEKSTGYFQGFPVYAYPATDYLKVPESEDSPDACREYSCNYTVLSGTSIRTLGQYQGSYVFYQEVSVSGGKNGENGKTVYQYSFSPDILNPYNHPIQRDDSWARGHLEKKTVYDAQGRLLTLDKNSYKSVERSLRTVKGLSARLVSQSWCEPLKPGRYNNQLEYFYTRYPSMWYRLEESRQEIRTYDKDDHMTVLKNSTSYRYGDRHLYPIEVETTDSRGKQQLNVASYSSDVLSEACIPCEEEYLSTMQAHHQAYNDCIGYLNAFYQGGNTEICFLVGGNAVKCYPKDDSGAFVFEVNEEKSYTLQLPDGTLVAFNALKTEPQSLGYGYAYSTWTEQRSGTFGDYDRFGKVTHQAYSCAEGMSSGCLDTFEANYQAARTRLTDCRTQQKACIEEGVNNTALPAHTRSLYAMRRKNMLQPALETQTWIREAGETTWRLQGATKTTYQLHQNTRNGQMPLPDTQWATELAETKAKSAEGIDRYFQPQGNFTYNPEGRIASVTSRKAPTTVYVWGYEGSFPVAQVLHATRAEVEAILGQGFVAKKGLSETQITALKKELPRAFVTTYTYDPLRGKTSETGPNGLTIYYEYDAFGRLQHVRDHENNIVKKYHYNYYQK